MAAKARHARSSKTAQLEPHREELLRLRRDGDSVEVLTTALRGVGVEISDEALRLWLNRELGLKPRKRQRRRVKPVASDRTVESPGVGGGVTPGRSAPISDTPVAGIAGTRLSAADTPVPQGTSLIRPGETPLEAFSRRQREREAAAAAAGVAKPRGRIARDDF